MSPLTERTQRLGHHSEKGPEPPVALPVLSSTGMCVAWIVSETSIVWQVMACGKDPLHYDVELIGGSDARLGDILT
ncbi:hypothetical protein GCM10009805_07580 [Leucobacter chromiireducens subsp. solipictus]